MDTQNLFYLAFLSQVVLLSYYFPAMLLRRTKRILKQHPSSEYPKLYPVPVGTIESKMRLFKYINTAIFVVGLAIAFTSAWKGATELLGWDSQSVTAIYFMLQVSPIIWATILGLDYTKKMRLQNQSNIRKAA